MDDYNRMRHEREEGLKQGKIEGLQQGLKQGKKEGLVEGSKRKTVEIVTNMIHKQMSNKDIFELTGISNDELEKIKTELK